MLKQPSPPQKITEKKRKSSSFSAHYASFIIQHCSFVPGPKKHPILTFGPYCPVTSPIFIWGAKIQEFANFSQSVSFFEIFGATFGTPLKNRAKFRYPKKNENGSVNLFGSFMFHARCVFSSSYFSHLWRSERGAKMTHTPPMHSHIARPRSSFLFICFMRKVGLSEVAIFDMPFSALTRVLFDHKKTKKNEANGHFQMLFLTNPALDYLSNRREWSRRPLLRGNQCCTFSFALGGTQP